MIVRHLQLHFVEAGEFGIVIISIEQVRMFLLLPIFQFVRFGASSASAMNVVSSIPYIIVHETMLRLISLSIQFPI
jgi:hypothetical protein